MVAGYGLGGSSVALFGRVGGGIYTKAADVGADLVGKNLKDLNEDDLSNFRSNSQCRKTSLVQILTILKFFQKILPEFTQICML